MDNSLLAVRDINHKHIVVGLEEELTLSEEVIGIKECRDLRMYIHEFTKGCVLTKGEYRDIMIVLGRAAD